MRFSAKVVEKACGALAGVWLAACAGPAVIADVEAEADSQADPEIEEVIIGTPGGDDDLQFIPLEPGGSVELETFGQGGTHALLAVRCIGLGTSAYITVTLENLLTGATSLANTPRTRPRPLLCRDEITCDLLPFLVMTSGLTEPGEDKDGLEVEIRADVTTETGRTATGSEVAVLRTNKL